MNIFRIFATKTNGNDLHRDVQEQFKKKSLGKNMLFKKYSGSDQYPSPFRNRRVKKNSTGGSVSVVTNYNISIVVYRSLYLSTIPVSVV